MVLAGAGQVVVETAALVFLGGVVAAATAAWLAVRATRRRMRRWRNARAAGPWLRRGAGGVVAAVAAAPVSDPRWWATQQQRHRMWRAVSSAERAVRAARAAQVPTGDLRQLVGQLRTAARTVDAALRADTHGRPASAARSEAAGIVAAAQEIHQVATEALIAVAGPETAGLAAAVQVEAAALRHGLAAAHR